MNTSSTALPNTIAMAADHGSKVQLWAFSAAVRLSDQDKPIALKLLVELAIVIRMLALLAKNAKCASAKAVVARRTTRPFVRGRASPARYGPQFRRALARRLQGPAIPALCNGHPFHFRPESDILRFYSAVKPSGILLAPSRKSDLHASSRTEQEQWGRRRSQRNCRHP
ncbi:MAG: hypothetical protein V4631_08900 [Pseudomonadota bacterium]